MKLTELLTWRYATKRMNGKTVPQEKLDYILEAARLAPSSSGLQPYEVFVISNRNILEKIKAIGFNQSQITECSHLLVFASWDGYTPEKIAEVLDRTVAERGLPVGTMDDYKKMLWDLYEPRGKEWQAVHTAKQAYISFSMALIAAAEQEVDATPMEGFDPQELDTILRLKEKGLRSAVILPIGYRDAENDWLLKMKKVRKAKEEFVREIK